MAKKPQLLVLESPWSPVLSVGTSMRPFLEAGKDHTLWADAKREAFKTAHEQLFCIYRRRSCPVCHSGLDKPGPYLIREIHLPPGSPLSRE